MQSRLPIPNSDFEPTGCPASATKALPLKHKNRELNLPAVQEGPSGSAMGDWLRVLALTKEPARVNSG